MVGRSVFLLAGLLPAALAYSDTHPLIAWSSHNEQALSVASKSTDANTFVESILSDPTICDHDAIVFVDQMGLHASDLRSLSPDATLVETIELAAASLEMPYMRRSTEGTYRDLASAVANRCGARLLSVSAGEVGPHLAEAQGKKHVVCMEMPVVEGNAEYRKKVFADHESQLSSEMEKIASAFAKHLVFYGGWSPSLQGRQSPDGAEHTPALEFAAPSQTTSPSKAAAAPTGGILKRYQLLTPGLIVALFVAFFILVPGIFMGISALSSIQSPVRLDAPKGYNAAEKKNQ